MRRCTRFLPSTAKWTALLLFAIAAYNAASPKAFAQSSNRVINLLCKDTGSPSEQGRVVIDLDKREMAGLKEGTTTVNGIVIVNTMTVTDAAYAMSSVTTGKGSEFYKSVRIDRVTGHLAWTWSNSNGQSGDSSAECQVITGAPSF